MESLDTTEVVMSEKRYLYVGDHVVYVDPKRQHHNALVLAVWSGQGGGEIYPESTSINFVIVSPDAHKEDSYGRQIERYTSIVHKSSQSAGANFWAFKDEL